MMFYTNLGKAPLGGLISTLPHRICPKMYLKRTALRGTWSTQIHADFKGTHPFHRELPILNLLAIRGVFRDAKKYLKSQPNLSNTTGRYMNSLHFLFLP